MISNAAIYTSDPSLIGSKLFDMFPEIKEVIPLSDDNKNASGMIVDLDFAQIQMNFMPQCDIATHLEGFERYIRDALDHDEDKLIYALARIEYISLVIGMIIEPSFDKEPKTLDFVLRFNNRLNGLVFLNDCLVDMDGTPLCGIIDNTTADNTNYANSNVKITTASKLWLLIKLFFKFG